MPLEALVNIHEATNACRRVYAVAENLLIYL